MKNVLKKLLFFLILTGCTQNTLVKGDLETTIYFATDLHLYSNNLLSIDNERYVKEAFTSDGRTQEYDYQLLENLVDNINNEKPDFFVLTGDLSFNGEKDSLIEVEKILSTVNEETKVLVIPGNHDCYSINPFSCINDNKERLVGVTSEEFKSIFQDYGYNAAYSLDSDSLSYIYELSSNKWILMLDTSLSEYNYEFGMNVVGGYIDESTYNWLEENLEYAKKNNIQVISATHHNLLVHNPLFENMYTLGNNDQILELYSKYQVRLNLSGHLHIQSIKSKIINDYEIYDIAMNSLLDYGNRYGKLEIYDNCYNYQAIKSQIKENTSFEDYSFNTFCDKYYAKSILTNEKIFGEDGEEVTKFLSEVNTYYFDGNYQKINKLKKENKSLYQLIKEKKTNYENDYVGTILEVSNQNQHSLLIEK